jgi:anti-sigma factor RsiW
MPSCTFLDPFVTPYVDGELAAVDRETVEQHLSACPPCRARIRHEQAVRDLIGSTRRVLHAECAPRSLHARCANPAGDVRRLPPPVDTFTGWRSRLRPLALAATLVIIVGGAFIYPVTARSTRIMAAELALDHMKCVLVNAAVGTHHSTARVEAALASGFGWPAHLPDQPEQAGLALIGERTCLYGEGRVAHLMYSHEGRTVSLFMLPDAVRGEEIVSVLGHRAAVWSVGGRTFVLVGREPHDEMRRMASFVRAGLR